MTDPTLPAPLVPAEVDLTDFQFMPLDVLRLRDSDLAAEETPEACWAAVLIWCASWHQTPAGSIPDSDQWQAKQAGYVARGRIDKAWNDVRRGALRNWVRCADGRLYHPVVAEKALIAWNEKLAQRARTKAATEAREAKRRAQQTPRDDQRDVANESTSRTTSRSANESKGQGQGQGEGIEKEGEVSSGAAAKTPRGSRKCPESFLVGVDLQQWARENVPAVDICAETAKLRDHTFKTAISDWSGAWRNWMRRAAPVRASHPQESFRERDERLAAEKAAAWMGRPSPAAANDLNTIDVEAYDVTPPALGR